MQVSKLSFAVSGLVGALMIAPDVLAHGSTEFPISRVYQCYLEGPEQLDSEACKAVVAKSGKSFLYDWTGINQLPNGNHKAFVPDGLLCAGGSAAKSGLDLPRTDWVKTEINAGANQFVYRQTAPHATQYFKWYITKQGWNQNQPLTWDSLELIGETGINEPGMVRHSATVNVPSNRSGYHVIYNVWQRSDSAEAFYACSDVVIGADNSQNSGGTTVVTPPVDAPAEAPNNDVGDDSNTLVGDYPSYIAGTLYQLKQRVNHSGATYQCEQPAWCSSEAAFYYEPGKGLAWQSAWSKVTANSMTDSNQGGTTQPDNNTSMDDGSANSGSMDKEVVDEPLVPNGMQIIGYIDGAPLLEAGVTLSLRFFDQQGGDLTTYKVRLKNAGDDWLTPLAKLVNHHSSSIKIGKYDEYGQLHIDSVDQLLNVYSHTGYARNFEIDISKELEAEQGSESANSVAQQPTIIMPDTITVAGSNGVWISLFSLSLLALTRRRKR